MYIKLDKQIMTLNVVCGVKEVYKPTKEIKQIHKLTEALKKKMDTFMKETMEPEMAAIQSLIDEENKKYIK